MLSPLKVSQFHTPPEPVGGGGYGEVISEREELSSLVSQVVDQLLVLPILAQQSLLPEDKQK